MRPRDTSPEAHAFQVEPTVDALAILADLTHRITWPHWHRRVLRRGNTSTRTMEADEGACRCAHGHESCRRCRRVLEGGQGQAAGRPARALGSTRRATSC